MIASYKVFIGRYKLIKSFKIFLFGIKKDMVDHTFFIVNGSIK